MDILRVEYAVLDEAAFLSHLEIMKAFERAIRRAQTPIAFSEGFNPHPKIAIAAPLAVGTEGKHEYLDLELTKAINPREFIENINKSLPLGIKVLKARMVPKTKPLMAVINCAGYRVELDVEKVEIPALRKAVQTFMEQDSVITVRKTQKGTKEIDVRKGVFELKTAFSVLSADLDMFLIMGNEGNVRPYEVVHAIFKFMDTIADDVIMKTSRTGLFIYQNGERKSPMNFGSEALV